MLTFLKEKLGLEHLLPKKKKKDLEFSLIWSIYYWKYLLIWNNLNIVEIDLNFKLVEKIITNLTLGVCRTNGSGEMPWTWDKML